MIDRTPAAVTLRLATPDDAAALAAFAARAFRETYAPPFGPCAPADVAAYVAAHFGPDVQRAELADPATVVVLAEHAGAIVGYAQLAHPSRPHDADGFAPRPDAPAALLADARPAELARFYVDRPWHGRGLAARLLAAATRALSARGAAWCWLSVYRRNPRAIAFYRREGFAPFADATFTMGADVQDDWLLARAVAPPGNEGATSDV